MAEHTTTILSDKTQISVATAWLNDVATTMKLAPHPLYRIRVCLEEVIVNRIVHGFSNHETGVINLHVRQIGNTLTLTVSDNGTFFDPTTTSPKTLSDPLETATVGGLGLQLLSTFSESLTYKRDTNKNILTITFEL